MDNETSAQEFEPSIEPYNEFGSPTVFARRGTVGTATRCGVNVPATGSVNYKPEEMREMATQIEENEESPLVNLLVGQGDAQELADALREAADWTEKVIEAEA